MKKKTYLDALRILAILCVIYNHTNERGYYLYAFPSGNILNCLYIALASLVAVAVPIFFMISGALLLGKEEDIETLMKKRVLRILLVILIFSLLQYAYLVLVHGTELSCSYFLTHITGDNIIAPYWYLYAYLAYLLVLPFLRKLVSVMEVRDFHYLFVLLLLVEGLFPLALYPLGITELNEFFVLPMLNRVVVYPLLGYYMEYLLPEEKYTKRGRNLMLLIMVCVLAFFILMTRIRALPFEEFTTYDKGLYTSSFTALLDAGVFYLFKYYDLRHDISEKGRKWIATLSGATFGVYLIEQPIRELTCGLCDFLVSYIGALPSCLVWVLAIYILATLLTLILKRLPVFRRLL